jgi:hypothetical protein
MHVTAIAAVIRHVDHGRPRRRSPSMSLERIVRPDYFRSTVKGSPSMIRFAR